MDISAIGALFLPIVFVFACVFYFQRIRWNRNLRRGKKFPGFYPTYSSLGNALQELQRMPQPEVVYVLQEKLSDKADEDDESGPKDPTKHLRRELKRMRNRESGQPKSFPQPTGLSRKAGVRDDYRLSICERERLTNRKLQKRAIALG